MKVHLKWLQPSEAEFSEIKLRLMVEAGNKMWAWRRWKLLIAKAVPLVVVKWKMKPSGIYTVLFTTELGTGLLIVCWCGALSNVCDLLSYSSSRKQKCICQNHQNVKYFFPLLNLSGTCLHCHCYYNYHQLTFMWKRKIKI